VVTTTGAVLFTVWFYYTAGCWGIEVLAKILEELEDWFVVVFVTLLAFLVVDWVGGVVWMTEELVFLELLDSVVADGATTTEGESVTGLQTW